VRRVPQEVIFFELHEKGPDRGLFYFQETLQIIDFQR
jgi:hypothetical protein